MQDTDICLMELAPPDRRAGKRHIAVILIAKLTTANGHSVCRVRNISEMGAKLESKLAHLVGDPVDLELRSDLHMSGRVVWVSDGCLGIQFDAPINVERFLVRPESRIDRVRPRAPRYKCSSAALVIIDGNTFTCSISDIALSGACLTALPSRHLLRSGQLLKIMLEGISAHHATVMWVESDYVGIKFRHPIKYTELEDWLVDNAHTAQPIGVPVSADRTHFCPPMH